MTHRFRADDPLLGIPAPAAASMRAWRTWITRWGLLAVELFMGISAIGGGAGLLINGLGMPHSALDHSPFDQFTIPAMILIMVGVGLVLAAWLVWNRHGLAPLASLAAGVALLGWIMGEAVMVRDGRPLQATVFLFALAIIALAGLLAHRLGARG
jgi:hypothetical protein